MGDSERAHETLVQIAGASFSKPGNTPGSFFARSECKSTICCDSRPQLFRTNAVPEVAALDSERRKLLETIFGWEGVGAAVAALAPGNILWSDDLVIAEVAKSKLGVERI
jgi:hypothetical protein